MKLARWSLFAVCLLPLSACVSELSVGRVPLARQDGGATADDDDDDDTPPARDAGSPVRDAEVSRADAALDADVGDACAASGCEPLDSGPTTPRDAASDASRDAASDASRDAGKRDAAVECDPLDCEIVGIRNADARVCSDGTPARCLPDERGVCDLRCPDPTGFTEPAQSDPSAAP